MLKEWRMSNSITMIIKNCGLVDLETGKVVENVTIAVRDDTIAEVTDRDLLGSRVIDLDGFYIMPGLINVHNNLSLVFPFKLTNPNEPESVTVLRCYRRAYDALLAGVTCLRTVGEIHRVDIHLRNMINAGWIEGPRIIAGGKGLGVTGGHGSSFGQVEADGTEEFRKAARRELALGADHLKIFITGGIAKLEEEFGEMQMTKDEIAAVTSVARSRGTYVAAHVGGSTAIIEAAEAGVTSFEHGYIINREAAKAIKEVSGYLVPTLSVTRSEEWMRANNFEEWTIDKALSIKDRHMESVKLAISEGVTLVCGTDIPPGDLNEGINATVREIEFIKEAGLNELEAIRTATINAAKLCRMENKVGLVKPGYKADLIAVPRNPLKDIRQIERIKFVMKGGEIIRNDIRTKEI
jgi:imidazolonepropionase-like amidohydrolase